MTNTQKIQLTPWHGGECPVDFNALTVIMFRDNCFGMCIKPNDMEWLHGHYDLDIIAYAVIECELIEPPHSTIIPPEVWAVLPDWVNCWATDENGYVYAYKDTPQAMEYSWYPSDHYFINITKLKGVIPAKCDWKDSLVWGPGCENRKTNN